ncbi:MAG: hypothetical protein KatS3mg013_1852 [Actinomycetota bacterium]|nr:MAG: hypothetical protein KatS3mg013_1852 [Actinomycetota bacterium]
MRRPWLLASIVTIALAVQVPAAGTEPTVNPRAAETYRPDLWITLCGLSTGCTINPPPHPWRGNDVYNRTGDRQRWAVRMQDGEGVRFWLRLENDGTQRDTVIVDGCAGNRRFVVNVVVVGKVRRPVHGYEKITEAFKDGTATFDLGPSSSGDRVVLTLNIIAPTTAEGVTYRCPIHLTSVGNPTRQDTVVAEMTTY